MAQAPVDRLRYVQTGGIGGLKFAADVDLSGLHPNDAAALSELAHAALAEDPAPPANDEVRDDQQYEITVDHGGQTTVLRTSDPVKQPAVAALVDALRGHARPTR